MSDLVYLTYKILTEIPYNIWFWFMFAAAPILVFVGKPKHSLNFRFWRLFLAAGCTYVLFNLSLGVSHHHAWQNYNACYEKSQYRDMSPERHDECIHHLDSVNDSAAVFLFLFGWIPATAYAGIFEAIWRFRYRKKIKEMGKSYKGKWFSAITIGFTVFLFVIYPFSVLVGAAILKLLNR